MSENGEGMEIPADLLRAQRNAALIEAADMQAYATVLQGQLAELRSQEPAVT